MWASFSIPAFAKWSFKCSGVISEHCDWILVVGGIQPALPATQEWYTPPSVDYVERCRYRQRSPQPPPEDSRWGANDPEHGRLWEIWCPEKLVLGEDGASNAYPTIIWQGLTYVDDGDYPPGGDYVDPRVLMSEARGSLDLPAPIPHLGPDAADLAVHVPTWMSVEDPGPLVSTATAGGITATITARLTRTTWEPGEPAHPATGAPVPAVTCDGPGTAYRPGLDPAAPPCGYTYRWRSLPERTGGTGAWTLTATATWTVDWALSTGETGAEETTVTATVPVEIREWLNSLARSVR